MKLTLSEIVARCETVETNVSIGGRTHTVFLHADDVQSFSDSLSELARKAAEASARPVVLETRGADAEPAVVEFKGRRYDCAPVAAAPAASVDGQSDEGE